MFLPVFRSLWGKLGDTSFPSSAAENEKNDMVSLNGKTLPMATATALMIAEPHEYSLEQRSCLIDDHTGQYPKAPDLVRQKGALAPSKRVIQERRVTCHYS
jgi:hypothetical protein